MIHYIYTLELAGDWQDLDIPELVRAADMYDLAEMVEMIRAVETGRPGR